MTAIRPLLAATFALAISGFGALAQTSKPEWIDDTLLEAAKKEGNLVVYTTTNEREALPLWKLFEDATGIKVNVVRASDSQILSRAMIEARARQKTWDVVQTANVQKFPDVMLAPVDLPEGKHLVKGAIAPDKRWYAVYANYNAPAFNTKYVKREDLPKTFEEFAKKSEWKAKVAIDDTDTVWLAVLFEHYGETKARAILKELVTNLQPVIVDGHLALARSVAAGEYWIALNNYLNLTLNVKMADGATDFWMLDPVSLFWGAVGVSANAPNPNAARLAANFQISREAQTFLAKFGRLPTRPDVETNPPKVLDSMTGLSVTAKLLSAEDEKKWSAVFSEIFRPRP
ncbi:MAG: hypothetical protein JWO28_914 [Hyphomicrobiales bacterium]|nr:hypothetical protein [Hyphomicrobiales bacterium]